VRVPAHGLLQEIVFVYALAVALLVVAGRLRIPPIVALITAGVLGGPSGLGLVPNQRDVETLSEIGVALLLFMAGLDFSIGELRRIWRRVVIGGTAQVVFTVILAVSIAVALGAVSPSRLFVVGLFVALSSTAIVLKELNRLNHAHAPHGRLAVGVLLLQDLIVIAVLVFLPFLLGTAGDTNVVVALVRVALVLSGIFLVGRYALPALLRVVSATSREAFSVAVLLASVGTAWLTSTLGLSMAVGAFLAGLVLAESEFSHQIHADVRPLRDLLASLFFISIGMLVDPLQMGSVLPVLATIALAMMVVKAAGAAGAFLLAGAPRRVAIASAVALAQIGEFSFVLGRSALNAGVLTRAEWQLLLGASILTMAATPSLVALAPGLGARLGRRRASADTGTDHLPSLTGHVVILGYGVGGRLIARALAELSTPYLILELNGDSVQRGKAAGEPIYYADATVREPLEAAGVARAAAVVALLSDPDASERAVRAVRSASPAVPLIVRTRYRLEADRLMKMGATLAIAEELEASLEVLAQLLARLHVPGNVVEVLLDAYRRTTTPTHGRSRPAPGVPLSNVLEIVDTPVATFRLSGGMWGAGRTLSELNLRAETGATVLAVRRATRTLSTPDGGFRLEVGDDLYLMGDDTDIRLARDRLEQGPRLAPRFGAP
jgi:CPA2 family monovalent cation:H+ antiporter-2